MDTDAEYLLGASEAERARLMAQCEIHGREAAWLLDQIGVGPGWRVIDVGCGPLGVLDLMDERVGPSGSVTGLDRDARMLEMAERSVAERDLGSVRLIQARAADTGLPAESFDLVHERLVLINVSYPEQVLGEMARLARPGGWVALQEVDWISWTCQPPHPAWDRLMTALIAAWREAGLDPFIGRRLEGMLRAAGLVDTDAEAHGYLWRPGTSTRRCSSPSSGCSGSGSWRPAPSASSSWTDWSPNWPSTSRGRTRRCCTPCSSKPGAASRSCEVRALSGLRLCAGHCLGSRCGRGGARPSTVARRRW